MMEATDNAAHENGGETAELVSDAMERDARRYPAGLGEDGR